MHKITFNGTASDTLGIRIERAPTIIRPRRKYDVISVPGRNGDIVLFQDAWDNYIQPYDIFIGDGTNLSAEQVAYGVSDWLHTANGYKKLMDSYETNIYRMAYYVDELDIENAITQYGRATINFNCRPERFYTTAGSVIQNGATINNPYKYASYPLFTINGTGTFDGYLKVVNGSTTYQIDFTGISTSIVLDCEYQNAYRSTTNLNDKITIVSGGEFPRLKPGNNVITWNTTAGYDTVILDTRWFTI